MLKAMQHNELKELKKGDLINSVYIINYKFSDVANIRTAKNGNCYVILKIQDSSISKKEYASVFFYFHSENDLSPLMDNYENRTRYLLVNGRCIEDYPNILIFANSVVPANNIVFNTSDLYNYDEEFKKEFISRDGKSNIPIRHTSSSVFQKNFDVITQGDKLRYERVYDSPYDTNQINIFVEGLDETFNIPAYLSPTMAHMIDKENYTFDITVSSVPTNGDGDNIKAGIRVNIRGYK